LPLLKQERIESVKVGVIAAIAFVFADLIFIVFHGSILAQQMTLFARLPLVLNLQMLVRIAIAWASGFLFGVTYRYIIRDDNNPHLKDGAVLAFGIVRGLALLEGKEAFSDRFWFSTILGIESIVCFAIARLTLDLAFQKKWVKPFQ
jgi:hypothetical protein